MVTAKKDDDLRTQPNALSKITEVELFQILDNAKANPLKCDNLDEIKKEIDRRFAELTSQVVGLQIAKTNLEKVKRAKAEAELAESLKDVAEKIRKQESPSYGLYKLIEILAVRGFEDYKVWQKSLKFFESEIEREQKKGSEVVTETKTTKPAASTGKKKPLKYFNPAQPEMTWSGVGEVPEWAQPYQIPGTKPRRFKDEIHIKEQTEQGDDRPELRRVPLVSNNPQPPKSA